MNRKEELEALKARIPPRSEHPMLTFLRSPSGFGKTRLTDRLIEDIPINGPSCVVVDPAIRSKGRSDRIYAWFFVQRAAESAALKTGKGRAEFLSFTDYIVKTQITRINWKHFYENLKEAASISTAIKLLIELCENLFKKGRYAPQEILQDDSFFSIQLAQDYVKSLAEYRPTVFIIRESQNIDPESLKFFLALGQFKHGVSIIFEYTTHDNRFSPSHEKIVLESLVLSDTLVIFDLLKLDLKEFRFLLRKYAPIDRNIEAAVELAWDGNLRIIKELKYKLTISHTIDPTIDVNLIRTLSDNLQSLSKRQRLLLAVISANIEAISRDALRTIIKRIDRSTAWDKFEFELEYLIKREKYVIDEGTNLALADEDLQDALGKSRSMNSMLRLGEVALRDFYIDIVKGDVFSYVTMNVALRQAFALCAKTGDIVALRGLIRILDRTLRHSYDQTLYVNIIAEIVLDNDNILDLERLELVEWAASLAYEVSDFPTVISLLLTLPDLTPYHTAMLACCYGELNRNDTALDLSHQLLSQAVGSNSTVTLVARLLECSCIYALGEKRKAEEIHTGMRSNPEFRQSKLFGFVLRFTEIIKDFPTCTSDLLESVDLFKSAGFKKSAAYSQLAAAMNLACEGQVEKAHQLVMEAELELSSHVRDRQTILNDTVFVALLSPNPDYKSLIGKLNMALFSARDDFSRIVLQNNLLICFWLGNERNLAIHCAEVIQGILEAPAFGNRDVFWVACYNSWKFFQEIGNEQRARQFKDIAFSLKTNDNNYQMYWNARFGIVSEFPPEFSFLMNFKYHPEYLSHWLIDQEGLDVLKEECVR